MPTAALEEPEVAPAVECPPTVEVDTRKLFDILTASWKSDMHVKASSNPYKVLENPAFQMTIALGKKVVPLIFKEYERQNDKWAIALSVILDFCPVLPEHYGKFEVIREDWMKWGKARGYL